MSTRARINYMARLYRKRYPEKFKGYRLKKDYGITLDKYNKMAAKQNNKCALCNLPEKALDSRTKQIKNLAVDHDHITSKVRGLLCWRCNTGIGKLKDSPRLLVKAANYIKKHRKN